MEYFSVIKSKKHLKVREGRGSIITEMELAVIKVETRGT